MKRTAKPRIANQDLLNALLGQAVQRRPYMSALALVTPGGQLMAAALPPNVEGETLAALAAPVALLGRRIALEQLNADMRQVFVEGEGGFTILRAIGNAAVLLTVATSNANIALVLHDVRQLEIHLSEVMGITNANATAKPQWAEAAGAIGKLRQLITDGKAPGLVEGQLEADRAKLDSRDLGYFPERVADLRARLNSPATIGDTEAVDQLEAELLQLEQDVMAALDQQMATAAEEEKQRQAAAAKRPARPAKSSGASTARTAPEAETLEPESQDQPNSSIIRRMLRWLASMIESND